MKSLQLLKRAFGYIGHPAYEHSLGVKEAADAISDEIKQYLYPDQQSFGQKAVGLSFNPSNDDSVNNCKQGFADLIDQMNELRANSASGEQKRLASVAITEMQTAQMWAVKALTWKD